MAVPDAALHLARPRLVTEGVIDSGEVGLLQTPKNSLYGLRHSFEDTMLAARIDESICCDIFGHGLKRERYGAGENH